MRRRRSASFYNGISVTVVMTFTVVAAMARAEVLKVHGEVGAEYDDNVHWTADASGGVGPARVGSPLGRAVLGWSAADRVGSNQDVAFSLLGAAKVFAAPDARSENVGVLETSGTWRVALGERTRLSVNGSTYDAIQAGTAAERDVSGVARDFRSLMPTLRVTRAVGSSSTWAFGAGYRWFVFKPQRAYDFVAPAAAIEYRIARENSDGSADWEALATVGAELRKFAGTRLVRETGCSAAARCTAVTDPDAQALHEDQFFSGRLDVTRTGHLLVGASYALQWNRSNSYSETLLRHAGAIRLTLPLPLGLYLATRAELVLVSYPDHAAFSTGPSGQSRTTIEDENRSQIRTELTRDISAHLQLVGRYCLYVNAIGQNSYQRQTATLSLAFGLD